MEGERTRRRGRKWYDRAHASLCLVGSHPRITGCFRPLEATVALKQMKIKYTAIQKLDMLFVSLLAGAKAVSHTGTTLRTEPALQAACGLPSCADQSVLGQTLNAATDADVAALWRTCETVLQQYSQALRHDLDDPASGPLTVDVDLSPAPASALAEGSERASLDRCRSKTGHTLVRVRAAPSQEFRWEDVRPGRTVETLARVQEVVVAVEGLPENATGTWISSSARGKASCSSSAMCCGRSTRCARRQACPRR